MGQLWAHATNEVLATVCPPYLASPAPEDTIPPSSIATRAIYEQSLLDDPRLAQLVRSYARLGEKIRIARDLPLKLTVVDGQSVVFNMSDPIEGGESVTTIVVHHRALATSLKITFEAIWSQAQAFDSHLEDVEGPSS